MKTKRLNALLLLLALTTAQCTGYRAFNSAQEQEVLKNWDEAVLEYSKALEVDPGNLKYKIALQRAQLEASRIHFQKGKSLRAAGDNRSAAIEMELALKLDPTNQYAAVELEKAVRALREEQLALDQKSIDAIKKRAITKAQPPELNPTSDKPISLTFSKPTPVKDIYRSLGNAYGINILFDQTVKDDERISIELRDVTAQQALERVMQAGNHFYKVLDEKSIIVVPDNPQMRKEYEDLVIRTFYLSNGNAEQVSNVVRTMIEARNVFPLPALNAITIRDTADKVLIAEKIIQANDKAKAEVVVDVELLQMDITKARELGMQLVAANGYGATLVGSDGKPITALLLDQLKDLSPYEWSLNIPSVQYGFLKTNSDSQLLAKPQLRISEGEKATLHIGQRIPVPVSTFTSANPGTGNTFAPVTSFQYQDVGIKISIEPRVHHNREITLKLEVEVSNLAGFAQATNPPQPIIGTRTIVSTIRLKDGETNFLAGLIRKDDGVSSGGVPFLSDLPIIGRIFEKERKDYSKTDLVLTMTPNIIRIADITEDDVAPMWVGTSNNLTFRGVSPRIESAVSGDPFNARDDEGAAAPAEMTPSPAPSQAPPGLVIPQGTGPRDPFNRPRPTPVEPQGQEEPPPTSVGVPGYRPRPTPPPPPTDDEMRYKSSYGPRISPQPAELSMNGGETARWTIMGMDLEKLGTSEIVLHYDPTALAVEDVSIGTAFRIDPASPPAVRVDAASGTIRITSSNDQPLQFASGGEILALKVRGMSAGAAMLTLEPIALTNAKGERVEAAVAGGLAHVK